MKISRLYIKIFISFILLLIITEILIFSAFRFILGNPFHKRFEQYVMGGALIIRTLTEEALSVPVKKKNDPYPGLHRLFMELESRYDLTVWIESKDKIVVSSFDGEGPVVPGSHREIVRENYRASWGMRGGHILVDIPLQAEAVPGAVLHIFYLQRGPKVLERDFALVLVLLGLIMAIILFPFTRYVTEPLKKLRASALRISRGHLDERVTVRGSDEIGELARAFNIMTERLEDMVTGTKTLTANISHEMRSPLARIRIAGELLESRLKNGDVAACTPLLETIKEEIQDMDTLIGQILQLTKMDIHGAESDRGTLDLKELLRDIIRRFGPALDSRHMGIETAFPDGKVLMEGNPHDLRIAINTILDNAVKYSPAGGTIRAAINADRDNLTLSMGNESDTPVDTQPVELLQPFRRGCNAVVPGNGLGLAIVKKVMENHRGEVLIDLRENIFTVTLRFPL